MKLKIRIIKEGRSVFPNDCQRMYVEGAFHLGMLNDFIKNDIPEEFSNFKDGEYRCEFELEEVPGEGQYELTNKVTEYAEQ